MYVVPFPLGGLATEIGGMTDQMTTLEASRLNGIFSGGWAAPVTIVGNNTWQVPPSWTPLDFTLQTASGVLIFFGLQVQPQLSVDDSDSVLFSFTIDGVNGAASFVSSGPTVASGEPVPTNNQPINGIMKIPDGESLGPLTFGDHTLQVQVLCETGATHVVQNAYAIVWNP